MGRGDLSDAEWDLIRPLLPVERGRWARPAGDNRGFLNGMLHVLRVGYPWRDMHERYGKWNSIYVRFRRWAEKGGGAVAQTFGRSRGGPSTALRRAFTSKVHARCDNQGLPIGFILTGGEASDYAAVDDLMALPLPKPKALLADKGYDGDRFREILLMRGILPIIPPRSNRRTPAHPDYRRYKDRNCIERMFGKLKQQRRRATRYDKTVLSFESFLNLASARLWLKSFVNAA